MSKSKQLLMQAGRALFWKHGFRRVSVDELCTKAGVSKMTFYRYFTDKAALAKAVFANEVELAMVDFRALLKSDKSGGEKLKGMLELKARYAKNLSQEFLVDFYEHNDTGLRQFIEQLSAETWRETLELLEENQQRGFFRADINLPFFLTLSQKLMDLASNEQLIKAAGGAEAMIMELSKLFAFGLAGDKSAER